MIKNYLGYYQSYIKKKKEDSSKLALN